MILCSPPQFGQCARSRSSTRLSSLAQLSRTGLGCAQFAPHRAGGAACHLQHRRLRHAPGPARRAKAAPLATVGVRVLGIDGFADGLFGLLVGQVGGRIGSPRLQRFSHMPRLAL